MVYQVNGTRSVSEEIGRTPRPRFASAPFEKWLSDFSVA